MLDERKVKTMTRLALYEQNQGEEDFYISEYYRKDYVGIHLWFTFFWVTLGYAIVVGIGVYMAMDVLTKIMSGAFLLFFAGGILIGYICVLGIYMVATSYIYGEKHKEARKRVRVYNHNLIRLLKLYEKENKRNG